MKEAAKIDEWISGQGASTQLPMHFPAHPYSRRLTLARPCPASTHLLRGQPKVSSHLTLYRLALQELIGHFHTRPHQQKRRHVLYRVGVLAKGQ